MSTLVSTLEHIEKAYMMGYARGKQHAAMKKAYVEREMVEVKHLGTNNGFSLRLLPTAPTAAQEWTARTDG